MKCDPMKGVRCVRGFGIERLSGDSKPISMAQAEKRFASSVLVLNDFHVYQWRSANVQ